MIKCEIFSKSLPRTELTTCGRQCTVRWMPPRWRAPRRHATCADDDDQSHLRSQLLLLSPAAAAAGLTTVKKNRPSLTLTMWRVSSRSGVATLQTAIHLLLAYLLTYTNQGVYKCSPTNFQEISIIHFSKIPEDFFTWQAIQYQTAGEVCNVYKRARDDERRPMLIIVPSNPLTNLWTTKPRTFLCIVY